MIKTTMLLPVRYNNGRLIPRSAWRALHQQLVLAFGGFSWRPGVRGTWVADERTYHDVNREYGVSLTSWRELPTWLFIVEWALERFDQEAVYIEVGGIPEILHRT
jgi:hypothetical protein